MLYVSEHIQSLSWTRHAFETAVFSLSLQRERKILLHYSYMIHPRAAQKVVPMDLPVFDIVRKPVRHSRYPVGIRTAILTAIARHHRTWVQVASTGAKPLGPWPNPWILSGMFPLALRAPPPGPP